MDTYDSYGREPPPSRAGMRERDDPYRDSRRRSPDRRRGTDRDRRRSRSPAPIDRYQPDRVPRDDYYGSRGLDDRRERRRSSPPPAQIDRYVPGMQEPTPPPQLLFNPLPDPMKIDFQVGFTWFAEWWRTEQRIKDEKERARTGKPLPRYRGERESREERDAERPKIQAAYDQYKEKLQKQQAQSFVRAHKDEDWFRERYVQEVREPFRSKLMDYRKGLFTQFESDLSSAVFDDFTLEGIYKSESNGAGGVVEREEGEASAAAEVLGVGDLLPSKGAELRDPAAQQPTLLIKTIAPTVSREKFEAFAKEHLGEEEGGFRHLSLSDPNPLKKCHRMGWIILHPEPEQEEMTDARAEEQEEGEEGETKPEKPPQLAPSEKALEKINAKTIEDPDRGNFTVHCGVHRPPDAPRKKALWDLFSAPERIGRDLELATRLVRKLDNEMGDEYFGVAKIEERVHYLAENGLLQPANPSGHVKASKDTNMDEVEDGEEDEGQVDDEDEIDDEELVIRKKKLDMLVEYLRRVYNFCFFCVFESDSVHELQRKCPGGHLRRPKASLTSYAKDVARASARGEAFPLKRNGGKSDPGKVEGEAPLLAEDNEMAIDFGSPVEEKKSLAAGVMKPGTKNLAQLQRAFNWVKTFEEKILQILEPENVSLRKLGGVPPEEGVEEDLSKFVKQEDSAKFRCKVPPSSPPPGSTGPPEVCTKLFKAPDFWRKHVEKRHADFFQKIVTEVELVNAYVIDPAHIAPSRSDPNSNGHFPSGPGGQPMGTPRGFSLNSFQAGFPGVPGVPMQGQPAMGMMPGMGGIPGMAMGGMPMMGGVGPMRSHGGMRMNGFGGGGRMPGPYARQDGRGRMSNMSNGRGPPMMGMMEGGAGAMGPQEAVQGRSLRSYEDLDAAGSKEVKAEDLDY